MINLALVDRTPVDNPDILLVKATFTGNYGVQGAGDPMDFTAITDPKLLGGLAQLNLPPTCPILVLSENIGGYYVQPSFPAAPTLKNFALLAYANATGELASNAAYPAAMTGGFVLLGIKLPPAV